MPDDEPNEAEEDHIDENFNVADVTKFLNRKPTKAKYDVMVKESNGRLCRLGNVYFKNGKCIIESL